MSFATVIMHCDKNILFRVHMSTFIRFLPTFRFALLISKTNMDDKINLYS